MQFEYRSATPINKPTEGNATGVRRYSASVAMT